MHAQRSDPTRQISGYATTISRVVSARGRQEAYIRPFELSADNIEQSSLGTIVGMFEVSDRSEASGYIVNFLVSTLRKEYFLNPRRGVIDSLEAALHKVNVALAELVKHGSISWLGKLSGVVATVDRDTLHFSVAGNAQVFLFRDGRSSEISAGLASPEAEAHPLKTFVEISTGKLQTGDKIALFSESVMTLFTPEQLARETERMQTDRFLQFLKTAITNELPRASAILIDIAEPLFAPPAVTRRKKGPPRTPEEKQNYFSAATFTKRETDREKPAAAAGQRASEASTLQNEPDYTDRKTGHIYIQGDETSAERPFRPFFLGWVTSRSSDIRFLIVRGGKRAFNAGKYVSTQSVESVQALGERVLGISRSFLSRATRGITDVPPSPSRTVTDPTRKESLSASDRPAAAESWGQSLFSQLRRFSPRTVGVLIIVIAIIVGGAFGLLSRDDAEESTPETARVNAPSPAPETDTTEPATPDVSVRELVQTPTLATFSVQGRAYAVSGDAIADLTTGESRPLPEGVGRLRLAAVMPDLASIFLLSESGRLFAFTPSNGRFAENTLPFRDVGTPVALSAYLTYLYILDDRGDLYRFPRQEGGFSEPRQWFKDGTKRSAARSMVVTETIMIGSEGSPAMERFSRGIIDTTFRFAPTRDVIPAAIAADDTGSIYVLNATRPELLLVDSTGAIVREYTHPVFTNRKHISLGSDGTLILSGENGVVSVSLPR